MVSHVKNNTGYYEWYTPSTIIEAARRTMHGIDLDPASSTEAQQWIKAGSYYTKEDDGLLLPWDGKVWLNPPYSAGLIGLFVDKLLSESGIEQAIVIVNNGTETTWGQKLMGAANALCFPKRRVKFLRPKGLEAPPKGAPLQGQMICGFGVDRERFKQEFESMGFVITTYHHHERSAS